MHVKLSELASPDIEWQLREAKNSMEKEAGNKVEAFSYPYAFPGEQETCKQFESNANDLGYTRGL